MVGSRACRPVRNRSRSCPATGRPARRASRRFHNILSVVSARCWMPSPLYSRMNSSIWLFSSWLSFNGCDRLVRGDHRLAEQAGRLALDVEILHAPRSRTAWNRSPTRAHFATAAHWVRWSSRSSPTLFSASACCQPSISSSRRTCRSPLRPDKDSCRRCPRSPWRPGQAPARRVDRRGAALDRMVERLGRIGDIEAHARPTGRARRESPPPALLLGDQQQVMRPCLYLVIAFRDGDASARSPSHRTGAPAYRARAS